MENHVWSEPRIPDPALDLQESIRRRAEEIYIQSGSIPGRDVENWTQAEQEIRELAAGRNGNRAIVVKVQGVQYVGEYNAETADGYVPGEIGPGTSVVVGLEGDKMFVKRKNGKELQPTLSEKSGNFREGSRARFS